MSDGLHRGLGLFSPGLRTGWRRVTNLVAVEALCFTSICLFLSVRSDSGGTGSGVSLCHAFSGRLVVLVPRNKHS